uniref:Uncharacterized protein n=1 Tax=Erythrolobus madagascarensis TaxID=708628 RepID=A0A7S0XJC2_9RHOD|mmetsp:Transcript_3360/g.7255  ORF Transcript_3360/g.7255 Transcript_3360/m.7255 type:complete len:358 (+) Transcript_3360:132-1205(+)|eukprot:CAMPEP_0185846000 /NCGR_PEP_ID=MMETSP1354-20130828/1801_1 /TAXON_ID=708628 /ORGANISM="Erythrolobus madagascarensis, Strain CCMP3276" /LENGTH=357 /DNA_ID=CAMNT_0028546083 /DNA_START=92 /DNA_END=1165 /DNA_ORIENTATION=+
MGATRRNGVMIAGAVLIVFAAVCTQTLAAPLAPSHFKALRNLFAERAEVIEPVPVSSSCIRNSTHCTCRQQSVTPLILTDTVLGNGNKMCSVSQYTKDEMACGCPGDSLCEVSEFGCNKVRKVEDGAESDGQVECKTSRGTCRKARNEQVCSSHSNVFIDGQLSACVRNVPVLSDVDDTYGYSNSRANNLEGALHDHINVRIVESTANSDVHMCVIFGNWRIGELEYAGDTAVRAEKARITSDFPISVEIIDDPSDQVVGDNTKEVLFSLSHSAQSTDGFCVGPLLNDGSGFRSTFFDLTNILGLNLQSSEEDFTISSKFLWTFADHRPSSALTPEGRTTGDASVTIDIQPTCHCSL